MTPEHVSELAPLLDKAAALVAEWSPTQSAAGPQAARAREAAAEAYDMGIRHAGETLARVLADLIDTDLLHSPVVLAALVPLLPAAQQAVAERAAADLKQLAETDHGAFLDELDARIARFGNRVRSGSPAGIAEGTAFLRNMLASPEAREMGLTEQDWVHQILRQETDPPDGDEAATAARMEHFREGLERMRTDPEYAAHIDRLVAEADAEIAAGPRGCPDGAICHHGCSYGCFRVAAAGPLTGVYPGDDWPHAIWKTHHDTDGVL
jgi:hypothetical protein